MKAGRTGEGLRPIRFHAGSELLVSLGWFVWAENALWIVDAALFRLAVFTGIEGTERAGWVLEAGAPLATLPNTSGREAKYLGER